MSLAVLGLALVQQAQHPHPGRPSNPMHYGAFAIVFTVFIVLMIVLAVFVVRFTIQQNRRRNASARPRPLGSDVSKRRQSAHGGAGGVDGEAPSSNGSSSGRRAST